MDERFVLEKHTDDPFYCWRVFDRDTYRVHGFGMLESDAAWLQATLTIENNASA
jgi:hypothetical protein